MSYSLMEKSVKNMTIEKILPHLGRFGEISYNGVYPALIVGEMKRLIGYEDHVAIHRPDGDPIIKSISSITGFKPLPKSLYIVLEKEPA